MSPHKCGHKSNRLVGWTYEANEEAISQAQENLDELDTQKRQEDLQYQIDIQERLKEIVENFEAEREIEQSIKNLEDWLKANGEYTSMSGMVSAIVEGFGKQTISVNFAEDGDNQEKTEAEKWEEAKGKVANALNAFKNLGEKPSETSPEYNDYAIKYNEALDTLDAALKTAKNFGQYKEEDFVEALKQNTAKKLGYSNIVDIGATDFDGLKKMGKTLLEDFSVKYNGTKYTLQASAKSGDGGGVEANKLIKAEMGEAINNKGKMVYHNRTNKLYTAVELSKGAAKKAGFGDNAAGWYWVPIQAGDKDEKDLKDLVKANEIPAAARGTESFQGGQTLINELGTEAVITPGGTLTALPSKTGIVPADITRNVWALGEVAPTLVAQLNSLTQKPVTGNVGNTTYEEGQYFDHFTMNVYPAKGDDLDKILQQARAHVALTRHNN